MQPTTNEKFLAYLALVSGITLSIVAEYYSILGLMAIFSAAPWSVVVMGVALGVGKITATLWLKQNWSIAPWSIRGYLLTAIAVLMLITSMGIFGFLSKAHSDQSLVSGDVLSKIAVYDEQIKTAKENIDANRKALKQMDEAVDQVMGRSQDEKGADKAVGLRRAQQKERARLQSEIAAEQKTIAGLSEERAPIAADVRKVEAEVGPIKYIAQFVYGETDETILEKAVTWVIIILIVVFDPLAVILLLSSQISFQNFRGRTKEIDWQARTDELLDIFDKEGNSPSGPVVDVVSPETTVTNLDDDAPVEFEWAEQGPAVQEVKVEKTLLEQHPYLNQPFASFKDLQPIVYKPDVKVELYAGDPNDFKEPWTEEEKLRLIEVMSGLYNVPTDPDESIADIERPGDYLDEPLFVQNEEQRDSGLWTKTAISITPQEYAEVSEEYKKEQLILYWANLVRTKQITMSDVPKHLLLEIRARV